MFRMVSTGRVVFAVGAAAPPPAERIDHDTNARIRQEGRERSQIMRTLHFLTDVYGPRLTGSPNHKAAAEWTVKQMTEWGFENGHLEPWDFNRPGWLNERFSGSSSSPVKDTSSVRCSGGRRRRQARSIADAVHIVPPIRPDARMS